jgi:hypothetical protein
MLIDPIANSVIYTNGQGLDLHTDPPNEFAIADAEYARIYNSIQEAQRNAPSGFAGLDNLSTVNAAVRVQYTDAATLDGLVPRSGELFVTSDTKELRYGDSFKQGGFRAGLSSKSQIYVGADGTQTENATALINAYARAKTASPNGAPKSNINRMMIVLGAGVYDLFAAGGITFDTPFIDIVGLGGTPDSVRINGQGITISETCYDWAWRNFTFYKNGTNYSWTFRYGDVALDPVVMNWENIKFEGALADLIMSGVTRQNGTVSSFNGTFRNVKTNCSQLLASAASVPANHTVNINFDDCQAGNRYISSIGGTRSTYTGTMRNCVFINTLNTAYDIASGAVLHNCKFGMPQNFVLSGARITYCRFVPAAGVASIKSAVAAQTAYIAHCELSATGIDVTNLTNSAGTAAQACNVLSDT